MPSPEGYNPNLSENINDRNEAGEINEMVDKNLLSRQEAGEFDYQNEMEIPEALLSKPPKISDSLRQQVTSKFPPESFEHENVDGIYIHGTCLQAIRPLWLGEGFTRTRNASSRCLKRDNSIKGKFGISGSFTRLGKDGFRHINERTIRRDPGFSALPDIPIFLVSGKFYSPDGKYIFKGRAEERKDFGIEPLPIIKGVVLAKPETKLAKKLLEKAETELEEQPSLLRKEELLKEIAILKNMIAKESEEDLYKVDDRPIYLTILQESNYVAHCMVQGVDKSKIVPIYDWDGNLLWPTEDDVIKTEGENDSVQDQN